MKRIETQHAPAGDFHDLLLIKFIRSARNTNCRLAGLVCSIMLVLASPSHAQWLTQSINLKAGWNAVFLHVDATHDTLNALVAGDIANPILEVWRWNPPSIAQFTDSPAQPTAAPEWTTWLRTDTSSPLQRLNGDTAYLVRVGTNVSSYTWRIKGRPVRPRPAAGG